MELRPLGNSGVKVSAICLGTMTWGTQNSEAEAFQQMDYALERGVFFWDTAEMYPAPPSAEGYARTEEIIGRWFRARKRRGEVVIATKAAGPDERLTFLRGGNPRFTKDQLRQAVEASLRRLHCETIDLYQLHWPERRGVNKFGQLFYRHQPGDDGTPLAETLAALGELVAEGKIRFIGLSNETPWGVMTCLALAEAGLGPRVVSIQNPYSLLNRSFEVGLAEIALREEVGLLAYAPLAAGVLTGKYLGGERPPGARLTLYPQSTTRYTKPAAEPAVAKYVELARRHGLRPETLAQAFVVSRPFVTASIIGATSLAQLEIAIDAATVPLDPSLLEEVEAIHALHTIPCP